MMELDALVAKIPAGASSTRLGTVDTLDGVRVVNVDGNLLTGSWADPMVVDDGDVVNVLIEGRGIGAKAFFSARNTDQPRPRTGEVTLVPAGSPTITVSVGGVSYSTEPVYAAPAVGDKVHLDWGAGTPRAIGKVVAVAKAKLVATPVPPPPGAAASGKLTAVPTRSRTYWPGGGWGSYAGDGGKVHQGTWFGATVTGAWFYGTKLKTLSGKTISRITFRTGARLAIGYNNAPAQFHFYAHTHSAQPAGDTNRVEGPHTWTAKAGQGPTTLDLPLSFAPHLLAGGGIAIAGEPYAGMLGTTRNSPDSGTLTLYWEG